MVGATVDLYCEDYWKKPKKDTWDDDKSVLVPTNLYLLCFLLAGTTGS